MEGIPTKTKIENGQLFILTASFTPKGKVIWKWAPTTEAEVVNRKEKRTQEIVKRASWWNRWIFRDLGKSYSHD